MRLFTFPLFAAIFFIAVPAAHGLDGGEMPQPPTFDIETAAKPQPLSPAAPPPVPCINVSGDVSIWIQLAGDDPAPAQQVYGTFLSWDPQTATIGFQSALSHRVEQIAIKSIRIEPNRPNPAAQMAMPNWVPLGSLFLSYPADALSVVDGVLKLPDCKAMQSGNPLLFRGELILNNQEISIRGEAFEVAPPPGGTGNSTLPKGG